MILCLSILSCTNNVADKHDHNEDHTDHDKKEAAEPGLSLNNGSKWTADDATRKNVAVLQSIVNEPNNAGMQSREQVSAQLQAILDTLVKECKMKGPDHDALHLWLNNVLHDVKQLRTAGERQYPQVWLKLKEDVESFRLYFA
jgi:hypothetical protein